jgi:hypothetical protein
MGRLVTLWQLARTLGLPPGWLRAEALAGRVPCLRVDRRLRFDAGAVESSLLRRAGEPQCSPRTAAKGGVA